ncbi:MAG: DUF420 domain-containing protein [Nannocystaceae bacterium]|nr:DUF420 domain-containing protein [Nannocystaceae bacterium]
MGDLVRTLSAGHRSHARAAAPDGRRSTRVLNTAIRAPITEKEIKKRQDPPTRTRYEVGMQGFLGTQASLLVDVSLSVFVLMPVALLGAIRWARMGEHRRHRTAQLSLFALMSIAVILLELDIRMEGGTDAVAGRAIEVPGDAVRALLLSHIAVAVVTWLGWGALLVTSWRRFGRADHPRPLPGSFSTAHRRTGRAVWVGNVFNAVSGTILYIVAFA